MNMSPDVKHLPAALCFWSLSVPPQYVAARDRPMSRKIIFKSAVFPLAVKAIRDTGEI